MDKNTAVAENTAMVLKNSRIDVAQRGWDLLYWGGDVFLLGDYGTVGGLSETIRLE